MAKKKKGGFKKGSAGKVKGAMIAVGALVIAAGVGYAVSSLANKTVGARGVVKHAVGGLVGGPAGAAGSVINDVVEGRGLDLSFSMPSLGSGGSSTATKAPGATF